MLLVGAGAATAVGATALAVAARRWRAADALSEGSPLDLPAGDERAVPTADGGALWVTDTGRRDAEATFVLAHGWTNDRRIWAAVARRLVAHGNRVVLWDHRGHGRSEVANGGFTLDALADDVRAVLEALDLRGVLLAGHSMGGMAAQAFAARHPDALAERVRALALVSTACNGLGGFPGEAAIGRRVMADARLDRLMASRWAGPALVRNVFGKTVSLGQLRAMTETFVGTRPEARAGFLTAMIAMDFAATLAAIDKPVAVMVGTRDRLTPPAHARRLAALLPQSTLLVFPGAGHMLPLEVPDDVVDGLEALLEPWAEQAGSAAGQAPLATPLAGRAASAPDAVTPPAGTAARRAPA